MAAQQSKYFFGKKKNIVIVGCFLLFTSFHQFICFLYVVFLKICRPFGRLWWDETVPTVVTRAEPHNQVSACLLY
jgi:hypothetical protein